MIAIDSDQLDLIRGRLAQIFGFLKELDAQRNPVRRHIDEQSWKLWLDDLPAHPSIDFVYPRATAEVATGDDQTPDEKVESVCLVVRRPVLTDCPPPPPELAEWVAERWNDFATKSVSFRETINLPTASGVAEVVAFEADPLRVEAGNTWLTVRAQWRESERPARDAMKLYERLYELRGTIDREAGKYELVLGDGIVSWATNQVSIYHPVILQRVRLEFDANEAEFRIIDTDLTIELNTALFQEVPQVAWPVLAKLAGQLRVSNLHPIAEECNAFLRGFIQSLSTESAHGHFGEKARPKEGCEHPTAGRAPVLYLRTKLAGYGGVIDDILADIPNCESFGEGLTGIVGVTPNSARPEVPTGGSREEAGEIEDRVLFGKKANPEQLEVASRLENHDSVLVQGPPGTGKSHTIANLIGHFVAQNKTILVTSHTTKALRVLRNHVVEQLQPMCISLIDDDAESRDKLKRSVEGISARLASDDPEMLLRKAKQTSDERSFRNQQRTKLRTELKEAIANEYRDIVLDGNAIWPSVAARQVNEGRGKDDWIPSPIAPGVPLPFSADELRDLYASTEKCTSEDEERVDEPLPGIESLLNPDAFAGAVGAINELSRNAAAFEPKFWRSWNDDVALVEPLTTIAECCADFSPWISQLELWQIAAVDAGRRGDGHATTWEHFVKKIEEVDAALAETALTRLKHQPEVEPEAVCEDHRRIVVKIIKHLKAGKSLSWWTLSRNPVWKSAIACWRVRGKLPGVVSEFKAVEQQISVELARQELATLWDGLMVPHGLPTASAMGDGGIETACLAYSDRLREAMEWWAQSWSPFENKLGKLGFDWQSFCRELPSIAGQYGETKRLLACVDQQLKSTLEATVNRLRMIQARRQLLKLDECLSEFTRYEVVEIRQAVAGYDRDAYAASYDVLTEAIERREHAWRRRRLILRLDGRDGNGNVVAKAWAHALRNREGIHGHAVPPGDAVAAWRWRQLDDELNRRADCDVAPLTEQLEALGEQIDGLTNELIESRAWAGVLGRITPKQRQALIGWLSLKKKIGGGYGKRVQDLQRQARENMRQCATAVPVWIMPLSSLRESFDIENAKFDVVIIDEASQCDVMGLIALYLAKQVIIVGDDEQVSPTDFSKSDDVKRLIALFLKNIPNSQLYDGTFSIYELAKQSFPGSIMLREHFRCVTPIIQFSNELSYDWKIRPLREHSSSPLHTAVVRHRVESYDRTGKINRVEALEVASLVVAATQNISYIKQTIGVISMVGDDQALEIDRLLRQHMPPHDYLERRIICGNAAQFQGDERDVIFLSLVDVPGAGPLALRQDSKMKQRFNVAASRARNQLWVVDSLNHNTDLKPNDLRRRLIEHAIDPYAISTQYEKAAARTESEFEKQVLRRLIAAGYRVTPQWKVGAYRIDLVVEGEGKRLAVECDGDRYHHTDEQIGNDMARQAILERLGWKFHRIRGTYFFRYPDEAMEQLFAALSKRGVEPIGMANTESDSNLTSDPVIDWVKRRAAELRAQWSQESENQNEEPARHAPQRQRQFELS